MFISVVSIFVIRVTDSIAAGRRKPELRVVGTEPGIVPDEIQIKEGIVFSGDFRNSPEYYDIWKQERAVFTEKIKVKPSPAAVPVSRPRRIPEGVREMSGLYYNDKINYQYAYNLGFDDGPNIREKITVSDDSGNEKELFVTDVILDVLKRYRIPATFFINGKWLVDQEGEPFPDARRILTRMIDEGHIIANHSFSHDNMSKGIYNNGINDAEEIASEIRRTQETVDSVLGYHYDLEYFRPPYANAGRNDKVDKMVSELEYKMIILHIDTFDYYMYRQFNPWNSGRFFSNLTETLKESTGGSILLHDLPKTAEMLPRIIEMLRETNNGNTTEFVQLDYLLKLKYLSLSGG